MPSPPREKNCRAPCPSASDPNHPTPSITGQQATQCRRRKLGCPGKKTENARGTPSQFQGRNYACQSPAIVKRGKSFWRQELGPKARPFAQPRATPWGTGRSRPALSAQRANRSPNELARWADNTGRSRPRSPGRCPGLGEPCPFGADRTSPDILPRPYATGKANGERRNRLIDSSCGCGKRDCSSVLMSARNSCSESAPYSVALFSGSRIGDN